MHREIVLCFRTAVMEVAFVLNADWICRDAHDALLS